MKHWIETNAGRNKVWLWISTLLTMVKHILLVNRLFPYPTDLENFNDNPDGALWSLGNSVGYTHLYPANGTRVLNG